MLTAVNQCASQAVSLLQDIYRDTIAEAPPGFMEKGGWAFISAVYSDAVSWFRGKSLHEPSERDYTIKPQGGREYEIKALWLSGEDTTSFAGPIMQASSEEEALRLRSLHLKLRRAYRDNNKARDVASILTQLEVQRSRLLSFFSQIRPTQGIESCLLGNPFWGLHFIGTIQVRSVITFLLFLIVIYGFFLKS